MRVVEPEPWSARACGSGRSPRACTGTRWRAGSAADGAAIDDLPLGEDAWVSFVISRDGRLVQVAGTELRAGDEVLVLADEDAPELRAVFARNADDPPEV